MQQKLLPHIQNPQQLKALSQNQLPQLAAELRAYIIEVVAQNEGHLGSSLGVVELTIALHYVFNTPHDKLVWDVGHQAYGHKILTERQSDFRSNRQLNGLSGFPKITESIYDTFGTGHASTSISAALGMAMAAQLQGHTAQQHIAIIGDASIASGLAFEGLNHAGVTNANILIVLNDNAISIDASVGALKNYFSEVKEGNNNGVPIAKALQFNYSGPIDGHDLPALIQELERQKTLKGPRFLHIVTTKGKGLLLAESNQTTYHAPGKFDATTGKILPKESNGINLKYQDVVGKTLLELASKNPNLVTITPAMLSGSGLKELHQQYPERTFDVGIAEAHAVTFAAGLVTQKMTVFCVVYATFLQRAYDQIIHDVALQNLPVIFCIDRAGLVGEDGPTHHGVFDIAFLNCIPNMQILAPLNAQELRNVLYTAQLNPQNPIAIRYPKGAIHLPSMSNDFESIDFKNVIPLQLGKDVAVLTTGTIGNEVHKALAEGTTAFSHYHFLSIKPINEEVLHQICKHYKKIITIEDGTQIGGFGSNISSFMQQNQYNISLVVLGIPDEFVTHGKVDALYQICKLDINSLKTFFSSI